MKQKNWFRKEDKHIGSNRKQIAIYTMLITHFVFSRQQYFDTAVANFPAVAL